MPPKKSANRQPAKRGRPSKAATLAAKSKKVVHSDIEVESEDDQSLCYPATPPPSGRRGNNTTVERSNKRHRDEASDDGSDGGKSEQSILAQKKAKKSRNQKKESADDGFADRESSEVEVISSDEELVTKSVKKLGTPFVIKNRLTSKRRVKAEDKETVLELSSSEEEKPVVKKGRNIKPIRFELPGAMLDADDGQKLDKADGSKGKKVVASKDVSASETEEEEDELEDKKAKAKEALIASLSAFEKNIREGGENKDVFSSFKGNKVVLLEDLLSSSTSTSDPCPEVDQVLDKSIQEPLLRRTYKGMANRSKRTVLSRTSEIGEPNPPISFFFDKDLFPDINEEFIIACLTFEHFKRHYNPSRVTPQRLTLLSSTSGQRDKLILATTYNCTEIGVALSVVTVKESYLHNPQDWSDNRTCKLFKGKFIQQEYTLWMSGLLMGFRLLEAYGPVSGGWVSFTCRPSSPDTQLSPARSRLTSTTDIKASLGSECQLIVLDGRNRTFGFNDDLYKLSSLLPAFPYEIPYGSLVLVAYVPNIYNGNQMGCSFSWVVVLATPSTAIIPPPRPVKARTIKSKSGEASSSK